MPETLVPKISVIVRSMDRPMLREALHSISSQTYANIEVIVVNALGDSHRPLGGECGRFPLRLIDAGKPLQRSAAANLGLDNASGEWIAFLDDDDWLAPEHFATVLDALRHSAGSQAAYAGVAVCDANGQAIDVPPFNAGFSAERLHLENYIPIHAIVFARSLLGSTVRFDEAFEVYEDWDFLLQLVQRTAFIHVNAVTAFYRDGGTSGVGINGETEKQKAARHRLFDKWKAQWSGAQLDHILQFARSQGTPEKKSLAEAQSALHQAHQALDEAHSALDEAHAARKQTQLVLKSRETSLNEITARIRELENQLADKEEAVQIAKGQLYDVYQSTSWRLTSPMRFIIRAKQRVLRGVKTVLRRTIQHALGQTQWPKGPPVVTQGFAGEAIVQPGPNPETPLVSVVMPVYNACRANKQFLIKALDSIANQTYKNVELVIVDDGSTDETHAVCQEYLAAHPDLRVQYLSKTNGGQSSARNFGIKASHGEYVGFLDQDDEWYENKLEKVIPWLANKDIDVLYTDSDSIDGDDKVTFGCIHGKYHCGWPHPKSSLDDILFKDIYVMPGLMTIKRSAFEAVGGFDEKLSGYEDDDLFLRLYERFKFFYLPTPTLRWRMYGDNYSFSHRMLTSRMYFWKKLITNYTDEGRDRYRVHMISLRFFWQFMGQAKMQYQVGNALCWESFKGAKEILPCLPWLQRMIFALVFYFPDKRMLPLLARTRTVMD